MTTTHISIFDLLEKNLGKSKTAHIKLLSEAGLNKSNGFDKEYLQEIIEAYNSFKLIQEQACATYARHFQKDVYGKPDTRKVKKVIEKILKNEGLWPHRTEFEYSSDAAFKMKPIIDYIVRFSASSLDGNNVSNSSAYDRGIEYEENCKSELENIGATVQKTSGGADFGADLIFKYKEYEFAGQCKALNKKAGIKCIQEVVAAKKHYKRTSAAAFSSSGFSDAAEALATTNKVLLFTGTDLSSIDRQIAVFF